jgi:hypothetical protein
MADPITSRPLMARDSNGLPTGAQINGAPATQMLLGQAQPPQPMQPSPLVQRRPNPAPTPSTSSARQHWVAAGSGLVQGAQPLSAARLAATRTSGPPTQLGQTRRGSFSYIVNRPVNLAGGLGQHMYIVTHADYLGDPNATVYDWGPAGLHGSKIDIVDPNSDTRRDDKGSWARGNQLGFNARRIEAPPEVVDDYARAVDYGGRDYSIPGGLPGHANSNAAPTAIALKATNLARRAAGLPPITDIEGVLPTQSNFRPGASKYKVVKFGRMTGKTYTFRVSGVGSAPSTARTVTCTIDGNGDFICR